MKISNSIVLLKYIYSCIYLFFNLYEIKSKKVLLKIFCKRLFNIKYFKFDDFSEFKKKFDNQKKERKLKKNHQWIADKFLIDLKKLNSYGNLSKKKSLQDRFSFNLLDQNSDDFQKKLSQAQKVKINNYQRNYLYNLSNVT